jgi:phage-related tail fiber protein
MSRARLLAAAFGADGTLNTSDVAGLSTVAVSGQYTDLLGKPVLATAATSGLFADLLSKPTTISGYGISDAQPLDADLTAIAALSGTSGFLKKTAANTWSLDTNTYLTGNQSITLSGDASGSGTTAISLTLANSGVTAGTYTKVTVDAKGRVTTGASLASGDLPTYTGTITSSQVTTALGYTPLSLAGGTMTGAITFAAGQTWPTFNQSTTGSAATLTTGRTIGMTGDVTWTSASFNGSANVTGTATLANSGVTAGSYGSSTAVPVITVDAKGRVTAASTQAISGSLTFTGDVTGTGSTGSNTALTLANSGVSAGTYRSVTVDAKGRVTAGTNPTTLSGYGITDALALSGGTLTGNVTVGTTASPATVTVVRNFGNNSSNFSSRPIGTAQGQISGYTLYATFQGTGDNGPRRVADIWGGYNGGAWGTEYLAFGVANAGDSANQTTERLRIGPAGQIGIGGANYGTSGQVLTSNGAGAAPSWQTAGGGGTPTMSVTSSTSFTAAASTHYVLVGGATTVTLPASTST